MGSNDIVDVALVHDEAELLAFRVAYMEPLVSHHVFVEADVTHRGRARGFSLTDIWPGSLPTNVQVVRIGIPPAVIECGDRWAIEEYSRQWAMRYASLNYPEATIIISDADEVPSRNQVEKLPNATKRYGRVALPMVTSYRHLNWLEHAGLPTWKKARAFLPAQFHHAMRFRYAHTLIALPGQHFRYLGYQADHVNLKHEDYAHQELDLGLSAHETALRLAEEFVLSNLPSTGKWGCGVLRVQGRHQLTDPATQLLQKRPELMKEPERVPGLVDRAAAASRLSRCFSERPGASWDAGGQPNTVEDFLETARQQLLVFAGLGVLTRTIRRVLDAGRSQRGRSVFDVVRGVNRFGDWGLESPDSMGIFRIMSVK